jgi:Dolichyl-phosphate-mannose-protein mannosyltransferase
LTPGSSRRLGLVFGGLVVIAFLARAWLVRGIHAPQLFCDEFIYSDIAKSMVTEGAPLLRGNRTLLNVLYPVLIAPAWLAHSAESAYGAAKTINVALMTFTAVPVYLWARRLVPPVHALVAGTLMLAMPAFVYTNLLLSENAFMPAFVMAVFAMALALERPTLSRQIFALAAVAVACAARTQGLVLLPVFIAAMALKISFDVAGVAENRFAAVWRAVRSYAPSVALLSAAALGYATYKVAQGHALSSGLGPYQELAHAHYSAQAALRWALYHFEELVLATGVFPITALVIMLALALRRSRVTTDAERSLLALTTSALVLLPLEAGLFASRFGDRLSERYTMYVIPLLILVLVLWIARGLPRPKLGAIVGIAIPVVALLGFPLTRFLRAPVYDSVTPFALLRVVPHLHGADIAWVIRIAALAVAVGAVAAPRRLAAISLPLLLVVAWVAVAWPVQGFLRTQAAGLRGSAPTTPDWIDQTIGAHHAAGFVYASGSDGIDIASHRLLETEFWNKSIRSVYATDAELCRLPERPFSFDASTGELASTSSHDVATNRYLVADQSFELSGEPLARRPPLTLYSIDRSRRVSRASQGVFADGWMGADASFDFYPPRSSRPGLLVLHLAHIGWSNTGISSATVRVGSLAIDSTGRASIGRVTDMAFSEIRKETTLTFRLRTPAQPYRVEVHVYPALSPSYLHVGTDPRGLGAVVELRPLARESP